MQAGVENLHMSSSLIAPATVAAIDSFNGIHSAVPLLYASAGVDLGGEVVYSYVFAVDNDSPFGGPWKMAGGSRSLEPDEVIIDADLADRYGLELGDRINILGAELSIAGLSKGTFGIATSLTFVNKAALANMMGVSPQAASYVLIQPSPGEDSVQLQRELEERFPDVDVLQTSDFVASDKEMIRQMGADVIGAMNVISYVVGMLVIGLTIYTATLERAREYGVLKAIGSNNAQMLKLVFAQAFFSAGLGTGAGILVGFALANVITAIFPEMLVLIEPEFILRQLPLLALITALGALIPVGRILRLDPLVVFRGG
jgi:putative ABC transport system permease protein